MNIYNNEYSQADWHNHLLGLLLDDDTVARILKYGFIATADDPKSGFEILKGLTFTSGKR